MASLRDKYFHRKEIGESSMKSIAKILRNLLIENMERLLWSKCESELGSLEAGSTQESEEAHTEWR